MRAQPRATSRASAGFHATAAAGVLGRRCGYEWRSRRCRYHAVRSPRTCECLSGLGPAIELDAVAFGIRGAKGAEFLASRDIRPELAGPFRQSGHGRQTQPDVKLRRPLDRLAALECDQHAGAAYAVLIGPQSKGLR